MSFANLKEPLNGGGVCALREILKLSDAATAKCCLGGSTFAKKEEEELVLRRFQRISRKSFRSSSSRAAKSCASRKIFTSALALSLSLSLSCHFSFAGCSGARAFQEHSRTVRNFIDLGDLKVLHAKSRILNKGGSLLGATNSLFKQGK